MPYVKKLNKILQVSNDKLPEYLDMGYSQIDENGKILKKGEPQTIAELKQEISRLKQENKRLLEQEITALKKLTK